MILFKTVQEQYSSVDKVLDFAKTRSYNDGARWNSARTPALYFSRNVQNAMLELMNYVDTPEEANLSYVVAVYEVPDSVRLHNVVPNELFDGWNDYPYSSRLQLLGDSHLKSPDIDGIIAPSVSINDDIARSSINLIRESCYNNVIINPDKEVFKKMSLIDTFEPVYNERVFD